MVQEERFATPDQTPRRCSSSRRMMRSHLCGLRLTSTLRWLGLINWKRWAGQWEAGVARRLQQITQRVPSISSVWQNLYTLAPSGQTLKCYTFILINHHKCLVAQESNLLCNVLHCVQETPTLPRTDGCKLHVGRDVRQLRCLKVCRATTKLLSVTARQRHSLFWFLEWFLLWVSTSFWSLCFFRVPLMWRTN